MWSTIWSMLLLVSTWEIQQCFLQCSAGPSAAFVSYHPSKLTVSFGYQVRQSSHFAHRSDSDGILGATNGESGYVGTRARIKNRMRQIFRQTNQRRLGSGSPPQEEESIDNYDNDAVTKNRPVGADLGAYNWNVDEVEKLLMNAFEPMEASLCAMENSLKEARASLDKAKSQASKAMEDIEEAAKLQADAAAKAVIEAEEAAELKVIEDIYDNWDIDVSSLSYDDVDYSSSEMAPPFLDDDQCLVPGEPVVRVERAPQNSRRIFAGVDIMADVDDVWKVLTNYAELQTVVPNLVLNEVLELYDAADEFQPCDPSRDDIVQAKHMAMQMKGALLKQIGGAKVAGLKFSARTTLEVREWPQGMPDFAHFTDEVWEGKSRDERAQESSSVKLQRYKFPRPFALSKLPTRDISMQSRENDDGEFRLYQGVWRLQPLPGCGAPGKPAMRLSYAVEISPRAYLPVQLVEGRIVKDLCSNLLAIRDFVSNSG